MARYAAFLRGVMPTNAKMPELRAAFEAAGFTDVVTVLGSGNVVFTARAAPETSLEKKAEAAMQKRLGRVFMAFVRSIDDLNALLATDPYGRVPAGARRVVTFLRAKPPASVRIPAELGRARIHRTKGREAFTSYVRGASTPEFMVLIEKTLGKDVTTRTWETVEKIAKKSRGGAPVRPRRRR